MTARKWYTFSGAIARLCAMLTTGSGDPVIQALGAFLYGSIDLLGVKGTAKLLLKLRRKHVSTSKKAKRGK